MVNILRVVTKGAAGAAIAGTSSVREASAEALHAPSPASRFVPLGAEDFEAGWDLCDCEGPGSFVAPSRDETLAAKNDLLTSIRSGSLRVHENGAPSGGAIGETLCGSTSGTASPRSAPSEVAAGDGLNVHNLVLRVGADMTQNMRPRFVQNQMAARALDAFERDPELQDVVCNLAQDRRVLNAIAGNPQVQQLLRRRGRNLLPEIPVPEADHEAMENEVRGEQSQSTRGGFAYFVFFLIEEIDKMRRFLGGMLHSVFGSNDEAENFGGGPEDEHHEKLAAILVLVIFVVCILLFKRPVII